MKLIFKLHSKNLGLQTDATAKFRVMYEEVFIFSKLKSRMQNTQSQRAAVWPPLFYVSKLLQYCARFNASAVLQIF